MGALGAFSISVVVLIVALCLPAQAPLPLPLEPCADASSCIDASCVTAETCSSSGYVDASLAPCYDCSSSHCCTECSGCDGCFTDCSKVCSGGNICCESEQQQPCWNFRSVDESADCVCASNASCWDETLVTEDDFWRGCAAAKCGILADDACYDASSYGSWACEYAHCGGKEPTCTPWGECVECYDSRDCPSDTSSVCCTSGALCGGQEYTCVGCMDSSDCSSGVCCTSEDYCTTDPGETNPGFFTCVGCLRDSDCKSGFQCCNYECTSGAC